MRKFVMESEISPPLVDNFILNMFMEKKQVDAGLSYYKFLENNKYKTSVITMCTYLKLYVEKGGPIVQSEKEYILNLYKSIVSEYELLNAVLANTLITSLCKIGEVEEAIKLLQKFESYDNTFLQEGYSSLIEYFYEHGNVDLGYKYLIAVLKTGSGPAVEAYKAYLKHYSRKTRNEFIEKIEELFRLWSKYGVIPLETVILEFVMNCRTVGWSVNQAKILSSKCDVCKQSLVESILTDKEYERLRKIIKDELFKKNMYSVTNPEEMQNFMKFIEKRKPYDVIVDGLNVFYMFKGDLFSFKESLMSYKGHDKKMLVIARLHMRNKIKKLDFDNRIDFYYVQDWAKDDVFLLYAAFTSGKNAIVVSNDFMRQHKFAIIKNKELYALFKKWQVSHQYSVRNKDNHMKHLNSEVQLDNIVQKQKNCWHVPYVSPYSASNAYYSTSNIEWICFNTSP